MAHFLDLGAPRRHRIGLFWFVATDRNLSRLAQCDVAIRSAQSDAAASSSDDLHALAWPIVRRTVRSLTDHAFDYFPRGCVEYGERRRTWIISLDRKLNRGAFIAEIVLAWKLSPPNVAVQVDPNFVSVACVGPPSIVWPTGKGKDNE